jgi:hypothetical protein
MACNRDESPLRPAALPPRIETFGRHRAILPIDPQAGGTWIAANDAGLILTLLNYYAAPHDRNAPKAARSRGTIIPSLLDADTLAEAFARTTMLDPAQFADFRLVLANRTSVAEVLRDGLNFVRTPPRKIERPLFFTSSGLGDAIVGPPRRALFEEMFVGDLVAQQDAYHRHSWPDRRQLSVCMRRADARTVSFTVAEHTDDGVRMMYHADAPDVPDAPRHEVRIPPLAA